MDYIRSLRLLSLLYAEAGENRSAVAARYKRAFMEGDSYLRLSALLSPLSFFGAEGTALFEEASRGAAEAAGMIAEPDRAIARVRLLGDRLESARRGGERILTSERLMSGEPIALSARRAKDAASFCRAAINAECCYLATFYGMDALKSLSFDPAAPPQALMRMLADRFNEEQLCFEQRDRMPYWRIRSAGRSGANAISYVGFQLEYIAPTAGEYERNAEAGSLRRIGAYLYIEQKAEHDLPTYYGAGNVIGLPIGECTALLSASVVTRAPVSQLSDSLRYGDPIGSIAAALQTNAFCISPLLFAEALDDRARTSTIESRRARRLCPLCGNPVQSGSATCGSHFSLP